VPRSPQLCAFLLQAGQADVDGGGWKYAVDEPNSLRLEFSSSGKVSARVDLSASRPQYFSSSRLFESIYLV
jgi:hypothetical protein